MSHRVIGIGQCAWDTLMRIGEYPAPDTKCEALEWVEAGGGPVATALVALARLECRTLFYGVAGDDAEGVRIGKALMEEGVDAGGLIIRPGARSQRAFITVEEGSGRRTIFWQRPTGAPLAPGELPEGFLDGADMLMLDGLMPEVSMYAARRARELGVPVMLDGGTLREGMMELAALADYLVVSERFARSLGYDGDADRFFATQPFDGARAFTFTLGQEGSYTLCGGEVFHQPAFRAKVVDTTGAGDVFHAGYAFGLLEGWDIQRTVRFASAFAALACGGLGGRSAIPRLHETMQLMLK